MVCAPSLKNKTMKKLILILAAITLLSCEKEEPFKEYQLTVMVQNMLPEGINGQVPTGYSYTYIENGEEKTEIGQYVGNTFKMYWNNKQPLIISARTPNECDIEISVFLEFSDMKPWKYSRGYRYTIIE